MGEVVDEGKALSSMQWQVQNFSFGITCYTKIYTFLESIL